MIARDGDVLHAPDAAMLADMTMTGAPRSATSEVAITTVRTTPRVEPWRQERALMLHLVEVERAEVLAAGGTPGTTRT